MSKSSTPKVSRRKARGTDRKTTSKVAAAETVRRKTTSKVAAEKVRHIHRKTAAQFEEFPVTQMPDTMRALAERRVALTREVYERSKNTLQSVLESWEESFGAAGQGALALNRKIIDIAERNINTGFDLATSLAGAKNLAEVMELQAAYWRKQFGDLKTHAEEVRALSTKSTAKVAEQFTVQVRRGTDETIKRTKST
jgi:hypothetical protein